MDVYPNAYYNYLKDRKHDYRERKVAFQREISQIYHKHGGTIGYRMIADYINDYNRCRILSKPTVYKYFHELGLHSTSHIRKYVYIKGEAHKIFPNLVNRCFNVKYSNSIWATDFTYMQNPDTGEKYYNCTIIDLCNRDVVATVNGPHIDADLAIRTLRKALKRRKPKKWLILHSDQGCQFASKAFTKYCRRHHIQQSMSRAGCPYDNAPMERFYNTFKNDFYNKYSFRSRAELDEATYRFAYVEYNYTRPHSCNNGLPPMLARNLTKAS